MAKTLHLLIPGLLTASSGDRAAFRPNAPALEWLLAHADPSPAPAHLDQLLFTQFGLPIPSDADLPVAAITRLADGGEPNHDWWLCADPVHLRADMHGGVFLADARVLAIEPDEAAGLVAAFNQTFAADGLWLEALHPERWYLRLSADPGIRTQPLHTVAGRNINALLPSGPNASRWHMLLTEIQMLFHGHPLNQAREARNQPLLNGIWCWGGGVLPASAQAPSAGVYAHDPLVRGLARLSETALNPLPERAKDWWDAATEEADSLVVLETARHDAADDDPTRWIEHLALLERDWFGPCRRWLQTGALTTVHLYPDNGHCYTLTRTARWRFWRRSRSLIHYLH